MKALVDTNVIVDALTSREPWKESAEKIFLMAANQVMDAYITASSATDIYYLVRKYTHSTDMAYKAVGKLLEIVKVCSVTNNDVVIAFQKKAKDFEDCLVATCAKSIHCDYIATRNKRDFEGFGIPVLTPTEILSSLNL